MNTEPSRDWTTEEWAEWAREINAQVEREPVQQDSWWLHYALIIGPSVVLVMLLVSYLCISVHSTTPKPSRIGQQRNSDIRIGGAIEFDDKVIFIEQDENDTGYWMRSFAGEGPMQIGDMKIRE